MNYTIENANNMMQIDGQPQNGILGANQGPRHSVENSNNDLTRLLETVKDRAARSADYIAPVNQLIKTSTDDGKPQIVIEHNRGHATQIFDMNDVAFTQLANQFEIAAPTARRLQAQFPKELDALFNAMFEKSDVVRMLRTHHYSTAELNESGYYAGCDKVGVLRAMLSNKFKTYDHNHMLKDCLPPIMESGAGYQVKQCTVTDKRLYLRLQSLNQTGTGANVGDVMANGIGLQNSEVGLGSVSVYQMVWTLACLNGMQTENKTRKSHITSARDTDDWGLLSDEAKDADNVALGLKMRDLVTVYSSRDAFDEVLEKMKRAAADVIDGHAVEKSDVVQNLGKVMQLTKKETSSVLDGLLDTIGQAGYEQGRPLSRATLVNAVTAVGNKAEADNVDIWQQRGAQVLNMKPADWQRVAAVAA